MNNVSAIGEKFVFSHYLEPVSEEAMNKELESIDAWLEANAEEPANEDTTTEQEQLDNATDSEACKESLQFVDEAAFEVFCEANAVKKERKAIAKKINKAVTEVLLNSGVNCKLGGMYIGGKNSDFLKGIGNTWLMGINANDELLVVGNVDPYTSMQASAYNSKALKNAIQNVGRVINADKKKFIKAIEDAIKIPVKDIKVEKGRLGVINVAVTLDKEKEEAATESVEDKIARLQAQLENVSNELSDLLNEKSNFDKYIDNKAAKADQYQKKADKLKKIANDNPGSSAGEAARNKADQARQAANKADDTGTRGKYADSDYGARNVKKEKEYGNRRSGAGRSEAQEIRKKVRDEYKNKAASNGRQVATQTRDRKPGSYA